jgi:hypothetical protein
MDSITCQECGNKTGWSSIYYTIDPTTLNRLTKYVEYFYPPSVHQYIWDKDKFTCKEVVRLYQSEQEHKLFYYVDEQKQPTCKFEPKTKLVNHVNDSNWSEWESLIPVSAQHLSLWEEDAGLKSYPPTSLASSTTSDSITETYSNPSDNEPSSPVEPVKPDFWEELQQKVVNTTRNRRPYPSDTDIDHEWENFISNKDDWVERTGNDTKVEDVSVVVDNIDRTQISVHMIMNNEDNESSGDNDGGGNVSSNETTNEDNESSGDNDGGGNESSGDNDGGGNVSSNETTNEDNESSGDNDGGGNVSSNETTNEDNESSGDNDGGNESGCSEIRPSMMSSFWGYMGY